MTQVSLLSAHYQHIIDSHPACSTKLTKYLVISIASIPMGAMTDTEFDAYWEEEARNPHRNRIRIGRQYQATIPPRLKAGKAIRAYSLWVDRLLLCPSGLTNPLPLPLYLVPV